MECIKWFMHYIYGAERAWIWGAALNQNGSIKWTQWNTVPAFGAYARLIHLIMWNKPFFVWCINQFDSAFWHWHKTAINQMLILQVYIPVCALHNLLIESKQEQRQDCNLTGMNSKTTSVFLTLFIFIFFGIVKPTCGANKAASRASNKRAFSTINIYLYFRQFCDYLKQGTPARAPRAAHDYLAKFS